MDTNVLALFILQLGIGLTFAAHGAQKVFGWWNGPGLAGWQGAMERMGYRPARLFALVSALIELVGGLLLAVGFLTPVVAAVLVAQTVVIIGQAHWSNGFFSTSSGFEFPMVLGIGAAALGLASPTPVSVDALVGLSVSPSVRLALLIAGLLVGLVTLSIPHRGSHQAPTRA
jgi:putative oxidoreductase